MLTKLDQKRYEQHLMSRFKARKRAKMDGNKLPLWLKIDPVRKARHFASPQELWEAATAYFQWAEENPIEEEVVTTYQGSISRHTELHPRALTMDSLALFCNTTTNRLETLETKEEFEMVMFAVKRVIREQKLSYAFHNMMNAMLVKADLGIADKSELTGPGGTPLQSVVQYQLPANNRDGTPKNAIQLPEPDHALPSNQRSLQFDPEEE